MRHRVYLSPGMFGFGELGSISYFAHLQRELAARFAAAGHELDATVIDVLPTASIRRRAAKLAAVIAQTTAADRGPDASAPIHLLGHSTGGLDARLVASPATRSLPDAELRWLPRLRSVTAMNTPHFGTPLASFFATANGERALGALAMVTGVGLSLGREPLAIARAALGLVRDGEHGLPVRLAIVDRTLASADGLVADVTAPAMRTFVGAIHDDQGSMLQLSPEAMDLVAASFADRPGVAYQCSASMAPSPSLKIWLAAARHPWRAVSLPVFFGLHRITARVPRRYPCAALRDTAPWSGDASEAALLRALACSPPLAANDGVVPIRSQLWGTLVWAGFGDHLDTIGHFRDDRDADAVPPAQFHRDWLASGSNFGRAQFGALVDAIARGMLAAAA
jgi:hypothetical protein